MNKKRVISLALSLVLLLSFCGCSTNKQVRIQSEDDIVGQDGCFLYQIIYAEGNSSIDGAEKETVNLKKQISETFDIKVNSASDSKIKKDSDTYEILVGNTNRVESKTAYKLLQDNRAQNLNDWIIKSIGNKICIVAIDDNNLAIAIRYFNVNFCTKLADFAEATEDYQYIDMKSYDVKDVEDVGICGNLIGKYTVITSKEKSLLYTLKLSEFIDVFAEKYGVEIKQGRDTDTKESKYEIIVGDTSRSIEGVDKPSDDKYIIATVGDKLVINGGSDVAIAAAVQKLIDIESEARKSGKPFEISKGFKAEGTAENDAGEYHHAWSDEFNGNFDKSVWKDLVGYPRKDPSTNGGTTYSRGIQNIFTRDGCAVLPSKRIGKTDFENSLMATSQSFAFRYGVVEVRAKLPKPPMVATMWGSAPMFSVDKNGNRNVELTPKNYYEFDMLENFGQTEWFASNVHQWIADGSRHHSLDGTKYAEQKKYVYPEGEAFYDDFHIFSCEWTPNGLKYAVDGEVYFHYDISKMDNIGFLQCPVDLIFSGGYSHAGYYMQKKIPDDAPEYGEYLIDYVRVYQNNSYDNILWYDPVK